MASVSYTIIDQVDQASSAVQKLMKEDILSVDGEGVNLSKTGPLTLVQVGKKDGHVFLFDVLKCPAIFKDGGLKSLLEDKRVLKVFHSSANDSDSLKCQFNIVLQNVFDTQVASMMLEESEGRQLPSRGKLQDVCEKYGVDTSSLNDKDHIGEKMDRIQGDYWATRPFTQEMIDYAAADVRVLIPELYETLNRKIELKGLGSALQERTEKDLRIRWDKKTKDDENARLDAIRDKILHEMEVKYKEPIDISTVENEDHKAAITRLRIEEAKQFNEVIQQIKHNEIKRLIEELKAEVEKKGDALCPKHFQFSLLRAGKEHPSSDVQKISDVVLGHLDAILRKDLAVKYNIQTPVNFLSETEKRFLRRLRLKGENDPSILRLYWLNAEESVDERIKEFHENPSAVDINKGEHGKYKFYLSNPLVPARIKQKAKNFLQELERAGKVQRPQPKRRYPPYNRYDDFDY